MNSQSTKLIVAALVMAGAGVFFYRYLTAPKNSGENLSQGTHWICKNPDCNEEFSMPLYKVAKFSKMGNGIPCPKCGKNNTVRAFQCPNCGGFYEPVGHGDDPEKCPHCDYRFHEGGVGEPQQASKEKPSKRGNVPQRGG